MPEVGRYAKMIAKPGRGDDLAAAMLAVAASLQDVPGCDLYVVNRELDDPETIWVTELWRSQEDLDAALQGDAAEPSIGAVRDLMDAFERIDLEPLGGVGHLQPEAGFTAVALDAVEDQAPKHGLAEMGEARFAHGDLEARQTGMSLQRLRPGRRQMFAHHHRRAEEVYVVLSGSGRARIDDEIVDLAPRDALRVAPASTRIFEAGPEGLELLVVGPRAAGDAVPVQDFGLD
jgi:quinol monooxygenase YgiN/mannose-6-phosphate isomerase-like protein (cupin superfamily)